MSDIYIYLQLNADSVKKWETTTKMKQTNKQKIQYQLQTIITSFTMMNNIIRNPTMAHAFCVRIIQGG